MYTKIKKLNEGFTIVETLIVLAIAALILTIVLIAVPDLQRAAKNSDMKTDADNVATGIQTFEGNNDGSLPTEITGPSASGSITISGATGTASATAHVSANDTIPPAEAFKATEPAYTLGTIQVMLDAECADVANGNGTPTQNNEGVAVFYPVEQSSSTGVEYCIQE